MTSRVKSPISTLVRDAKIVRIEEKPADPKSNLVVTGCYLYDARVFDFIRMLVPSGRGEFEVTDLNNLYVEEGTLSYDVLKGWWTDAGTPASKLKRVHPRGPREGGDLPRVRRGPKGRFPDTAHEDSTRKERRTPAMIQRLDSLSRKGAKAAVLPSGVTSRRRADDLVILIYHRIGVRAREIGLPSPAFEAQLSYLADQENILTVDEAVGSEPNGGVVVTFDDDPATSTNPPFRSWCVTGSQRSSTSRLVIRRAIGSKHCRRARVSPGRSSRTWCRRVSSRWGATPTHTSRSRVLPSARPRTRSAGPRS